MRNSIAFLLPIKRQLSGDLLVSESSPFFGSRLTPPLSRRLCWSAVASRSPSALLVADAPDAEFSGGGMELEDPSARPRSLIDTSLESDPEMKDVVVEFVELTPAGNQKYIDCRVPFTVDLDGVTYVIGTPNDPVVAVITDDEDGETTMLDADDNSKEEIFQIAAAALVKYMGEDLRLKRTPRVLTVEGDLDAYTREWVQEDKVALEDFLKDEDEADQFFDDFFKSELGPNYQEEFLIDEQSDEEAESLLKMFSIPGVGTEEGNTEGIQQMLREIESGEDLTDSAETAEVENTKGLPLFPFRGPDNKTYALVQITQPVLLVGKQDPRIDKGQMLLLNEDDACNVLPLIKSEFHEMMEANGLSD